MGISSLPDGVASRQQHRFGSHTETYQTQFADKFPFTCTDNNNTCISEFDVTFDVINGELPFLIGLPTLLEMNANLNFNH